GGEGRTRLRQLKLRPSDIAALAGALALGVGIGVMRQFGI
ncbi:MAG: energy-coupling factor transporter transmembrane protein EcfT, partial [Clostridiales bacterium]|nr:energy-coupling factor transporter transmembrane protein EcfT [Clostridiales bacterium]